MPRDHHRLNTDIWDEASIRSLRRLQQQAYLLVLSQADLSRCGVLAYRPRRWAMTSADGTEKALRRDFAALTVTRHVVVDEQSEELFARTYVRHDHILNSPNVVAALVSDFQLITSNTIRLAFLTEMRRLWSLPDLPPGERGGWLLAMGHFPQPTAGDESAEWPRTMKPNALARIRKAIKTGLRGHLLSAIHAGQVPEFDPGSPEGIPEPFRDTFTEPHGEPSAEPIGEPFTEPPGDTRTRAPSPSPSPTPSPSPLPAAAAPANLPNPTPPPPKRQLPPAVQQLRDQLDDAGLTVRWDRLTAGEIMNITELLDVHGPKPLIDAARRAWRPDAPAASATAWLGLWRDLRPPRPRAKPQPCPDHPTLGPITGQCSPCASERKAAV